MNRYDTTYLNTEAAIALIIIGGVLILCMWAMSLFFKKGKHEKGNHD